METHKVWDVDCNVCAGHAQKALDKVMGINNIDIRLNEKEAVVTFDASLITKKEVTAKIEDFGYHAE
jgi:Cu+-exporting ATPase